MKLDACTERRDDIPYSMLDFMQLNAKLADLDVPALRGDTGILSGARMRGAATSVQLDEFIPLYQRFAGALNTHVYLEDSREKPPSLDEYELLCYCMISADTLADGIKRAIKFVSALNGRGGALSLAIAGDKAVVACEPAWKNRTISALSLDMLALTYYGKLFAWLIDEPLQDLELVFSHKALLDPVYLHDLMNCRSRYEDAENALIFNRALLLRPIVKTQRQLTDMLARGPLELLPGPESKRISVHVHNMLRKALVEQEKLPSLDRVAYQLGQSGSTLRRRLMDEGSSFQGLLDECRKARALELLACSRLTIDEISWSLGFSERSSFSHAFKSWMNQTPSTYRDTIRQLQANESRVA